MIPLPPSTQIFLACGATDMRKGFDGLAVMTQQVLEESPHSGALFAFRGKRGDLVKMLWYDGQGMCLVFQADGPWPVRVALNQDGVGGDDAGAAFDAIGRHRLAAPGAYIYPVTGRIKRRDYGAFSGLKTADLLYDRSVGCRLFHP